MLSFINRIKKNFQFYSMEMTGDINLEDNNSEQDQEVKFSGNFSIFQSSSSISLKYKDINAIKEKIKDTSSTDTIKEEIKTFSMDAERSNIDEILTDMSNEIINPLLRPHINTILQNYSDQFTLLQEKVECLKEEQKQLNSLLKDAQKDNLTEDKIKNQKKNLIEVQKGLRDEIEKIKSAMKDEIKEKIYPVYYQEIKEYCSFKKSQEKTPSYKYQALQDWLSLSIYRNRAQQQALYMRYHKNEIKNFKDENDMRSAILKVLQENQKKQKCAFNSNSLSLLAQIVDDSADDNTVINLLDEIDTKENIDKFIKYREIYTAFLVFERLKLQAESLKLQGSHSICSEIREIFYQELESEYHNVEENMNKEKNSASQELVRELLLNILEKILKAKDNSKDLDIGLQQQVSNLVQQNISEEKFSEQLQALMDSLKTQK